MHKLDFSSATEVKSIMLINAFIFTQDFRSTQDCLYTSGGLINIISLLEIPGKVGEFDETGEWSASVMAAFTAFCPVPE